MTGTAPERPRRIQLVFAPGAGADGSGRGGLLGSDPRVRTLVGILVSYPEVRHVRPDRVSLDARADARTLETLARFLERQRWLVRAVTVA